MANIINQILGVRAYDLATRRANVVTPASFAIGGIMGNFQRKYAQAIPISSPSQFLTVFGGYYNSAAYGPDVVNDFFNNLAGYSGSLYVASYVGNTAGSINAVQASLNVYDTQASPAACLKVGAAWQNIVQYGADGGNTGITITTGNRFAATCVLAPAAAWTGVTGTIVLNSNIITSIAGGPALSNAWIGQAIANANLPAGTTIIGWAGTQITVSNPATGAGVAQALVITQITFYLNSIADIEVGDAVFVTWTGGTSSSQGAIVTAINSAANSVTTAGTPIVANSYQKVADPLTVPGFQIQVYRQNAQGVVTQVDTNLSAQWCTFYSAVADHFVGNIWAKSNFIQISALTDTPANPVQAQPAAFAVIQFLLGGVDGTAFSGAASWANTLALFNGLPVRFLTNAEDSTSGTQIAGEVYCYNRWDHPCWIYGYTANQTLAQGVVTGNGYQRSGLVSGMSGSLTWGYKTDPYQASASAPYRAVPPMGAIMGLAVRIIAKYGIHFTYGLAQEPIVGWQDVYGFQAPADTDRTTLAQAGMNVIQNMVGSGIVLRNSLTPSTTVDYLFVNSLIMGNYIRVSCQGSLQSTENFPLTFQKLQADRSAIDNFMRNLWATGSTGNVPEGETFGQTIVQNLDGSIVGSTYEQNVSIEANLANNPNAALQAGNEQIWVYFMRPAPAQSIQIGVGIQLTP